MEKEILHIYHEQMQLESLCKVTTVVDSFVRFSVIV